MLTIAIVERDELAYVPNVYREFEDFFSLELAGIIA